MNLSSEWRSFEGKKTTVYNYVSNLNNIGHLMPEQVINWKAENDTCSFTIKGMTDLSLKIDGVKENELIRLVPNGKTPFEFELLVHLRELTENQTQTKVELNGDVNPMLAMMVKRPLQNLVNVIAEKLSLQKF